MAFLELDGTATWTEVEGKVIVVGKKGMKEFGFERQQMTSNADCIPYLPLIKHAELLDPENGFLNGDELTLIVIVSNCRSMKLTT